MTLVMSSAGISVTDFIIKSGCAVSRGIDLSMEAELYPSQRDEFLIWVRYGSDLLGFQTW